MEQQNPAGDWRKGGYRDAYQRTPPPPRKPSPLARELIYRYQGLQRSLRTLGIICLLISIPILFFLGDGIPSDLALSAFGKTQSAKVVGRRILTNVEVNDVHPTEIQYRYEVEDRIFEGVSYTTKDAIIQNAAVDSTITIEVSPGTPTRSRMMGTTVSPMGAPYVFVSILPLVSLFLLGWAIRSNRREIRAFRDGTATKGLIKKRGINDRIEINGENPYEIVWEFQVDGTMYEGKLSHMKLEPLNQAFPDDEVTVLYDPRDPKVNTVWLE